MILTKKELIKKNVTEYKIKMSDYTSFIPSKIWVVKLYYNSVNKRSTRDLDIKYIQTMLKNMEYLWIE